MPNTNYQTFHQMGSAVNDLVRQASGRDELQNIDMDFVTVARNHYAVHEEYSGSVVSFQAHVETPMGLIVQVNPFQAGTGDPSPDNVRPITGWTGCNITVSPTQDAEASTTYSITFPDSAGIVYGGTLTVNKDGTGTLIVNKVSVAMASLNWSPEQRSAEWDTFKISRTALGAAKTSDIISNVFHYTGVNPWKLQYPATYSNLYLSVPTLSSFDTSALTALLTEVNAQLVYVLASPVTYNLTNLDQIKTLIGTNNVWADTGDITVQFTDIVED